jgi:hypothetical protein
MASTGPGSTYGQVHYMVLHRLLPNLLFSGEMSDFVESCSAGQQGGFIYENLWLPLATKFADSPKDIRHAKRKIDASSFPLLFDQVVGENRLLVIGAPPPESTPQARYVGLWFSRLNPDNLDKYFASEVSIEPDLIGDVLGEWNSEGSHHNFGDYCAADSATPAIFAAAIFRTLQVSVGESSGSQISTRSRADVRKRVKQIVSEDFEVEDIEISWTSPSSKLGTEIFNHLRRLQQSGRKVLILSAESASGLRVPVSTYFQFKILNRKTLLAEIQGDYSYWGVTVPSGEWHKFNTVGFASPTAANGNFSMNFNDFRDDGDLKAWLVKAVEVMQNVIKPEGPIGVRFF